MTTGDQPDQPCLSATTVALLEPNDTERRARLDPSILDVSNGEGVPIGTLGSGHSVFGRNGFSRVAFSGAPDMGPDFQNLRHPAEFAFFLSEGDHTTVLQERIPIWRNGATRQEIDCIERIHAYAGLPKAHYRFEHTRLDLDLVMTAFSPLIAHDVETSALPVQVFEITLRNRASRTRSIELRLGHAETMGVRNGSARLATTKGHLVFAADQGEADPNGAFLATNLEPNECRTARFFIAWYFPEFRTPSPAATATYRRHYAARFENAREVVDLAKSSADAWSSAIDEWRASIDVPPEMKRLWFSSLSSVITSTMLSDDPFFFAIESPHDWVSTMDVAVYANWVYLVNWPELERLDLDQYLRVIGLAGENAGFVPHSLWSDASHYAEEPTYLTRLWRAYLWLNDIDWLREAADSARAAANYAHTNDSFEHLLNSKKGNQSYDEWMMPGVSAYVNVTWLYALHALARIGQTLGDSQAVGGANVEDLVPRVRANLLRRLWSYQGHGYFQCFYRTPGSDASSVDDAVFTDQLFGKWVLLIDEGSTDVLPQAHVAGALRTIYENNAVEDRATGFRGWANGMCPGRRPDTVSGYHVRTCWLGAQLNLASLLGAVGEEARSLDVFRSIEASLDGNHLAVGEWNRAIDGARNVVVLDHWGKDTPRFPPYPRYTSSWEYLVRMLGLTIGGSHVNLRPFRSLRFELRAVRLAGVVLSVRVEPNWKRALVDGVEVATPVAFRRDIGSCLVEFVAD